MGMSAPSEQGSCLSGLLVFKKHLCAWHPLSVNIYWVNAEAVNSWCRWTVCPRKEKQKLVIDKGQMNNEASEISSLFHFLWGNPAIAFCYILCIGGGVSSSWPLISGKLGCGYVPESQALPWTYSLGAGNRDVQKSASVQVIIQIQSLVQPLSKPQPDFEYVENFVRTQISGLHC